jgi:hypothetical protein
MAGFRCSSCRDLVLNYKLALKTWCDVTADNDAERNGTVKSPSLTGAN